MVGLCHPDAGPPGCFHLCNALDSSAQDGVCAKMGINATRGTGVEGQRITLPPEVLSRADELLRETEGGKIWN